jgi:hypothetical protein
MASSDVPSIVINVVKLGINREALDVRPVAV